MNKISTPIIIAAFSFISWNSFAQEVHPFSGEPLKYCGSTEATNELYKKYPLLKAAAEAIEEQQNAQKTDPSVITQGTVYTIPVVFHIIHNYGPENIPDANIYDAIRVLNEDYRKLNADTSDVVAAFKNIIGDAELHFELAKLDPNGNCTNGIEHIASSKTYKADDASKLNIWPRNKYLNVWTVNSIGSGAAGYSYFPSMVAGVPTIDGVLILYNYIGSLSPSSVGTSRALGHEIGHWLNLPHVWGNNNNPGVACGDDGVTDTPVTKGWTTCNLTNNAICTSGVIENVQNIMEYAYCQRMFTVGQCARMKNAIQSAVSQRNNLWSAANLAATGVSSPTQLCKADFTVDKDIICAGNSVTFTDLSWNTTPTSWQWDFDNNNTVDATTQNPTYTYTIPGVYAVKLTAGDGVSTQTVTKTSYVTVLASAASTPAPYAEGFENAGFPYADSYLVNASGNTNKWAQTTSAFSSGTSSIELENFTPTSGDINEFVTPAIDLSTITSPTMTFKVAHAQRNTTDADVLSVSTSSNCGNTWTQRYSKAGITLASTGSVVATAFTPSASQWRMETVNIANVAGQSSVRFKFQFTSMGAGNNIYIDDINIMSGNGVAEELAAGFDLNVFPNPFTDNSTISFNTQDKYNVAVSLYDVVGKEVLSISNTAQLNAGSYSLPLSRNNLKAGIYFVKLTVDGYSVTKKVIVQ